MSRTTAYCYCCNVTLMSIKPSKVTAVLNSVLCKHEYEKRYSNLILLPKYTKQAYCLFVWTPSKKEAAAQNLDLSFTSQQTPSTRLTFIQDRRTSIYKLSQIRYVLTTQFPFGNCPERSSGNLIFFLYWFVYYIMHTYQGSKYPATQSIPGIQVILIRILEAFHIICLWGYEKMSRFFSSFPVGRKQMIVEFFKKSEKPPTL